MPNAPKRKSQPIDDPRYSPDDLRIDEHPVLGGDADAIRARYVAQSRINGDQFNTKLSPSEEKQFQQWKSEYAPKDSGYDYDLRGAYKEGFKPSENGHWPDKYKKPNEPTFSNQSNYAKQYPNLAGAWDDKDNFILPTNQRINPMAETDLERQKRLAAEQNSFEAYRDAFQKEGQMGGLINGRPSADAIDQVPVKKGIPVNDAGDRYISDGDPRSIARIRNAKLAENPPPQDQVAQSYGYSDPDQVMANAERISAGRKQQQDAQGSLVHDSYNQFLVDRNIDPNDLNGSKLFTREDGSRGIDVPTIASQDKAFRAKGLVDAVQSRKRLAARGYERRGDYGSSASILNDLQFQDNAMGGRSSEDRLQTATAIDLMKKMLPFVQHYHQTQTSNGFASPPGASAGSAGGIGAPAPQPWDWNRYRYNV